MSKAINNINTDFEKVLQLIQEARNRVYAKANAELVLLYFNVGKTVSEKVTAGKWGENTVQELANFISARQPNLSGFNRRGLYRMKQFYETYNIGSACFLLWLSIADNNVSPLATHTQSIENDLDTKSNPLTKPIKKAVKEIVSPLATQLEMHNSFLNHILLKISWTNHLEIFSSTKKAEEVLFYTLMSLKENWTKEELRRQIKTASFERTMLSKQENIMLKAVMTK